MTAQERIDAALVAREKATPGPWHVMENGFGKISGGFPTVYATDDELRYIAKCADYVNMRTTDNNANATLIAAAPDLAAEVARLRALVAEQAKTIEQMYQRIKSDGEKLCLLLGSQTASSAPIPGLEKSWNDLKESIKEPWLQPKKIDYADGGTK